MEKDQKVNHNDFTESYQIGLHSAAQLFQSKKPISKTIERRLESEPSIQDEATQAISHYGIDLHEFQLEVMECILQLFTNTKYKGNIQPTSLKEVNTKSLHGSGDISSVYQRVEAVPRIRVTQKEILDVMGIDRSNRSQKQKVMEALSTLSERMYCIDYERMAVDSNGDPIRDPRGMLVKEYVCVVDTLFMVKEVKTKANRLKYYEITPSLVFLDQRPRHFMLVPNNWREEVIEHLGGRQAASNTCRFLLYLRYEYQNRARRSNGTFLKRWKEVAETLRISKSIIQRHPKRAKEMLTKIYESAASLGYLKEFSNEGEFDKFVLNSEKYHSSDSFRTLGGAVRKEVVEKKDGDHVSGKAKNLLKEYHLLRKSLDSGYFPESSASAKFLRVFERMFQVRSFSEIMEAMKWGMTQKFWVGPLCSPEQFEARFSSMVSEMNLKRGIQVSPESEKENISWGKWLEPQLCERKENRKLGAVVEFNQEGFTGYSGGVKQIPAFVSYSEREFREKVGELLVRYRFFDEKELLMVVGLGSNK